MLQEGCAVRGIKEIVETSKEKPRTQSTELDITAAIFHFPGWLVTNQAFKKFASRSLRSVQKQEYHHCIQRLQHYGSVVELRVPCCAQKVHAFFKKTAGEIISWSADVPCSQEQHNEWILEPLNPLITENIKTVQINAGHITNADLVWTLCIITHSPMQEQELLLLRNIFQWDNGCSFLELMIVTTLVFHLSITCLVLINVTLH